MLTTKGPVLTYIHPRDWEKKQSYKALRFGDNFEAFLAGRNNLLPVLERLSFQDWNRSATFTGKANTNTIFGEVVRTARHELDHCKQLETSLKSR